MTDYSNLKVTELRALLKERGLAVNGIKDKLVRRLQTSDNKTEETEENPAKKRKVEEEQLPSDEEVAAFLKPLTDESWKAVLAPEFEKPYFRRLVAFIEKERKAKAIYPPADEVFNAFNLTPFDKVKVVIIGQDPYHDKDQAHGLCFSVKRGQKVPPSLKAIYKELTTDIKGFQEPSHGNLENWARAGVFLLNATLTVEHKKPNSHADSGWQKFTDAAIQAINQKAQHPVVFLLWGAFAQKKGKIINREKHHIIEAPHPSPMTGGKFGGCKVFSKTNAFLVEKGLEPIDWSLPLE